MTQEQKASRAIYWDYQYTPKRDLLDVYQNPSREKLNAEYLIKYHMLKVGGSGYKVLHFNSQTFVCAYKIESKNQLVYFTAKYKRIVDLNNFTVVYKEYNLLQ